MNFLRQEPRAVFDGKVPLLAGCLLSALLVLPEAYAKDIRTVQNSDRVSLDHSSARVSQFPALTVKGKVYGLQSTTHRADGAVLTHEPVSGKGQIEAEHVIIDNMISPGNSPGCIDFSGNVTFTSSALLLMEIAGSNPCTEFDRISVNNTLTVNGAILKLELLNGYAPVFQQRFDILDWGLFNGSFSSIDTSVAILPYPLQWDLSEIYLTGEVIVGVIHIADGDLAPFDNPDGLINAADALIATQLVLDQRVAGALQYTHGDMNSDGVIDTADLILIQQLVLQN